MTVLGYCEEDEISNSNKYWVIELVFWNKIC